MNGSTAADVAPAASRRALVTGGTRGIGLAIARRLRADGARVAITGRDAGRGAQVAREIGASFFAADFAEAEAPSRLREAIEREFGGLDALVCNAGDLGPRSSVAETTAEAMDRVLTVHLKAPWLLMQALAPTMPPGSSIVMMASVAGHRVGATSVAYSVAKAALLHLTRCAASELGAKGLRVNSVSPGFIATDIHAQALAPGNPRGEEFVDGLSRMFRKRQALDRAGAPEHVADLVSFLTSDAAAFVTGADFPIDGGLMWGRAGAI